MYFVFLRKERSKKTGNESASVMPPTHSLNFVRHAFRQQIWPSIIIDNTCFTLQVPARSKILHRDAFSELRVILTELVYIIAWFVVIFAINTTLCGTFIASLHEDNPIIIPSLDVRRELLVWRLLVKLKLFILSLSPKLLAARFIARTEEKPGVCIKLKSGSKIYTTWHWTMILKGHDFSQKFYNSAVAEGWGTST